MFALFLVSLAFADRTPVEDGEVVQKHCVDGRCIGFWEGPSMGGCMGGCCNEHHYWLGTGKDEGRLLDVVWPSDTEYGETAGVDTSMHPVSVRWTARDEVEVIRMGSLLPHDQLDLDDWSLSGLRATGLVASRYVLRGDRLEGVSTRWVHEGDRELARALREQLPPATSFRTPTVDEVPDRRTKKLIDPVCPVEHDRVWAVARAPRTQLWFLGTYEGSESPLHVSCVVHVVEDEPAAYRLPGEGDLYLSEARACVVGGVAFGSRGWSGGLACYDLKAPGMLATFELAGHVVSSIESYPLRYQDEDPSGALALALSVDAVDRRAVSWGEEHWSGPADLSARWKAARVADALVLQVRVTDDRVETGTGPLSDHVEVDVWRGPHDRKPPETRLAIVRDGDAVLVRRWRSKGEEVDTASAGKATWTPVPGGYEVTLTLPRGEGLDQAGDYTLGVRASDGEGGTQVVVEQRATITWDNQWPPAAAGM